MTPDDFISFLDAIGERLTGPSAHVWELVVRQVVAESLIKGAIELIVLIIGIVIVTIISRAILRSTHDGEDKAFAFGLVGISVTFAGGLIVTDLSSNLIHLLNPEYAAIERIVNVLQGAL